MVGGLQKEVEKAERNLRLWQIKIDVKMLGIYIG